MADLYRQNVGVVVVNTQGKVLMCARADQPGLQWQFPQGGIEKGEDIIVAARRELYEETGIVSVTLLHVLPEKLRYDFPDNALKKYDALYKGQEQSWVLFEFFGSDDEINFLVHPEEIEFKAFEWVNISDAPKRIVPFKKDVYQKVSAKFEAFIKERIDRERKI